MPDIVDLSSPHPYRDVFHRPEELPHGLVPPPQSVRDEVAEMASSIARERNFVISEEARKRMLEDLTLQYYYEDWFIAFRSTPEGPEVLAVGEDEIERLIKGLSQEELRTFIIKQP